MRKPRRLPLEELAPFLWPPAAAPDAAFDAAAVFGNDHPVEIEVGFGKGLFLLTAATAKPDVNFLGVEVMRGLQLYVATRMAIRGLRNVRVACTDARLLLRDRVPSGSVQTVHVYFPDPWWKKRHHKRRVFNPEFVASCAKALRIGGRLSVATDVAEYFVLITELVGQEPRFRALPPPELAPAPGMDHITNFQRKAREQGRDVHAAQWERVAAPAGA